MKNTHSGKKLIALTGPTASGKTELAVKLAKKLGGEIISADSRLVYRDFNIGTAKPDEAEKQGIAHHMIDIADPTENYTAGRYKKDASELLEKIPLPIIAGGTGFYVKALLEGLDMPEIGPDEEFREAMKKLGADELHVRLCNSDPVMAKKLHKNDTFRIIRALEVQHLAKRPMSEVQSITKPDYDVFYVGLNASDRDFLYERINRRVDRMLDMGLIEEVQGLVQKYGKTLSLLNTLGYKEICEYLDGLCSLEQAAEKIRKNTRNFAKRQLTWFRANRDINWFYIDEAGLDEICEAVIGQIH